MKYIRHFRIDDGNLKPFALEHVGETFKVDKVTTDFVDIVQEVEQTEAEYNMTVLNKLLVDEAAGIVDEKAAIAYAIECIKTLDDMGILKGVRTMIKSEKGIVHVTGEDFDVIFEMHHLIKSLCEQSPELISAVMYKNHDNLVQAITKSNPDECDRIETVIDFIEQMRKEHTNDRQ